MIIKRTLVLLSFCVSILFLINTAALAAPLTKMERLGKRMFMDPNYSRNATQSCNTCHDKRLAYVDPANVADPDNSVVSIGDDGVSTGDRNSPTAAYAGYSPKLHFDTQKGGYVGGMFWDGRATGWILGDPLAEQAQGPPLNPVEMNMPSKEAVVEVIRHAPYVGLFLQVFGPDSLNDVDEAYDDFARAIAAFERSRWVQKFSSRFDAGDLNGQELRGLELFKANCSKCHSADPGPGGSPALFTDYSYHNIGLPPNPLLADKGKDLGLGGFLEKDYESSSPIIGDANYQAQYGKFKVPTLRNIALTAPYGHNGYFSSLREMVSFHNSRDNGSWPAPEVEENLDHDVGNMGLSEQEIDDIVAFLHTLTDSRGHGRGHGGR